jgi:oxepin-CoA hydrolase/3-oxo-5,6-dehydrosuberyl-CoA semialdehyde dehydrogenase
MQQKTGQKCTAIRRVYVPRTRLADVVAALTERLASIKVGDPSREDVTMGPVATAQQLRDVRAGIGKLMQCATIAFGSNESVDPLRAPVTGAGKGYFTTPVLLVGERPGASDPVHNHEVFGPVATVMPYDGSGAVAAGMLAWGGGGLVSSLYSDDKPFLKEALLHTASFHGRVTVGSSKIASQAIPPGTVLPQLLHGGPGRAGSGEELGGRRGLAFYMQRTAFQGDKALLEGLLG